MAPQNINCKLIEWSISTSNRPIRLFTIFCFFLITVNIEATAQKTLRVITSLHGQNIDWADQIWSDTSPWNASCFCTPTADDEVIIDGDGTNVTYSTTGGVANKVTVESNSTLAINGSDNLNIRERFIVNGELTASSGVEFSEGSPTLTVNSDAAQIGQLVIGGGGVALTIDGTATDPLEISNNILYKSNSDGSSITNNIGLDITNNIDFDVDTGTKSNSFTNAQGAVLNLASFGFVNGANASITISNEGTLDVESPIDFLSNTVSIASTGSLTFQGDIKGANQTNLDNDGDFTYGGTGIGFEALNWNNEDGKTVTFNGSGVNQSEINPDAGGFASLVISNGEHRVGNLDIEIESLHIGDNSVFNISNVNSDPTNGPFVEIKNSITIENGATFQGDANAYVELKPDPPLDEMTVTVNGGTANIGVFRGYGNTTFTGNGSVDLGAYSIKNDATEVIFDSEITFETNHIVAIDVSGATIQNKSDNLIINDGIDFIGDSDNNRVVNEGTVNFEGNGLVVDFVPGSGQIPNGNVIENEIGATINVDQGVIDLKYGSRLENSGDFNFTDNPPSGSNLIVRNINSINEPKGTINLASGGTISVRANFVNEGTMNVDQMTFSDSDATFTNNGTLNQTGAFLALEGSETIVNNGTWDYSGEPDNYANDYKDKISLSHGIGSSFEYSGENSQTIIASNYQNVILSGNGTKSLDETVTIEGDLEMDANINLDHDLKVEGDFTHTSGSFDDGSLGGFLTFTGSENQNIINAPGGISISNLKIDKEDGTVSATDELTISNQLVLENGLLVSDKVTIENDESDAVQASDPFNSYLIGSMSRTTNSTDTYSFPIGDENGHQLVEVTPVSAAPATFEASVGDGLVDDQTVDGDLQRAHSGGWSLEGDAAAHLRIYWNPTVGNEISDITTIVVATQDASDNWISNGDADNYHDYGDGNGYVETANPINEFPVNFTVGSTSVNNKLPVVLTFWQVESTSNGILLKWETAVEINNDRFDILHSSDGESFLKIGTVEGSGSTNSLTQYRYLDSYPDEGFNFYQLKQVDYDGNFELFEIKMIENRNDSDSEMIVFPNPTIDFLFLRHFGTHGDVNVELVDNTGKVLIQKSLQANEEQSRLDLRTLLPGVYFLKIDQLTETRSAINNSDYIIIKD